MSRKEGHGAEEKVSIVWRIMRREISIRAACREVGVNQEPICGWVVRYEAEGGC